MCVLAIVLQALEGGKYIYRIYSKHHSSFFPLLLFLYSFRPNFFAFLRTKIKKLTSSSYLWMRNQLSKWSYHFLTTFPSFFLRFLFFENEYCNFKRKTDDIVLLNGWLDQTSIRPWNAIKNQPIANWNTMREGSRYSSNVCLCVYINLQKFKIEKV